MNGTTAARERGSQAGELAMAVAENAERAGHLQDRLQGLAHLVCGKQMDEEGPTPEGPADGLIQDFEQIIRRATRKLSECHDIMTFLEQQLTSNRDQQDVESRKLAPPPSIRGGGNLGIQG